ncbi:TPA: hypothetical protein G9F27_000608 [Salmonella enterica]|uniref:Uncharacterized protein n=1 Tax=Salmonella enterica TaxID=28901 RepID=A0A743SIQ2_SALER|nr:hypothetical protein [Salmonella enterica]
MSLHDIRDEVSSQSSDVSLQPSDVALYDCFMKVTEDIELLFFLASLIPVCSYDEDFNQLDSFRRTFVKLISFVDADFRALQQSFYNSQSR